MSSSWNGQQLRVVDSHTEGEPTRIIVEGGPDLGAGSVAEQLVRFRAAYDHVRSAAVNEPRGSDAVVGALLCQPSDPTCSAGVIFFNNVGFLNMCGHGTIGLAVTLAYLGRISAGTHRIETPVGIVEATLHLAGQVTVRNVPSYRYKANVAVEVDGFGTVCGDIAWGGNWFFLTEASPCTLDFSAIHELTEFAWKVRQGLDRAGITGEGGALIDHIEISGPPTWLDADRKNFVLCPGRAYDRSPCGTGTSAKMACLYAEGKLAEGDIWRQESIIGSLFSGSIRVGADPKFVLPEITGSAYITADSRLILDPNDPFVHGIRLQVV